MTARLKHSASTDSLRFEEGMAGCAGAVVFCSISWRAITPDEPYQCHTHVYDLGPADDLLPVSQLPLEEDDAAHLLKRLRAYMRRAGDFDYELEDDGDPLDAQLVDSETGRSFTLEEVFDGRAEAQIVDALDGNFAWEIQEMRARIAHECGYFGCLDRDDQGDVAMIYTRGRCDELNGRLSYVGCIYDTEDA